MSFDIDWDYLPATLNCQPTTDEEFMAFCQEHPDLNFEMTAEGELIVMCPSPFLTGARGAHLLGDLGNWTEQDGCGLCFDPSTGYVIPNGARRSPKVSWVLKTQIPREDGFLHLSPDFLIELKSSRDRLAKLEEKMHKYMANGTQLGWLINPDDHSVTIYRPDGETETRKGIDSITGEGPVATFTLNLKRIWKPF